MPTPKHSGTIERGEFVPDDPDRWLRHLSSFRDDTRVTATIKREARTRTGPQRRYYFGVIVTMVSHHTGHEIEEVHLNLKMNYIRVLEDGTQVVGLPAERDKNGLLRIGSTKKFSTKQQEEYNEIIRRWAAVELFLNIPEPNQVDWL